MRKKHPALIKLGNNIRELRKLKNLSQEAFADEIGLDRTYVGGIERGERNLAALNIIRIAVALDVEVGQLFPSINILRAEIK
ncbi:helix-turn-helix domain-containing protein [Legionella micdadei]|uniref:DNA-binding transcriptional regulator, XRE-family HTH domain n=1 Tax=Legionella micdadei TaxID=451 RepID=A0A098GH89_LEGMI|nr:helix-turn-helix transcriptional regulator [Legionella micdadei]ARG96762.1 transcriptional regulator [Legionella micdadei]KTD26431.1 Regulatory protein munI (modular protein) [Legionella micdadei]NSL17977.1 helix-turn-helix transcriptional regulator [Legionella micdadei]CEG61853.1 Regulatory protein munI [Legionella micdadei]SCY25543.1 DNA-binding transcriptional regulator, XRE-family HTH domain [Legionella micdadei]